MHDAADVIRAIATLAWPLVVLLLLLVYKRDVVQLLKRLRRGKLFGQELEFDLDQLDASANAAEEVASKGLPAPSPVVPP